MLYYLQWRARWKDNVGILGYRKALLLLCMFRRHKWGAGVAEKLSQVMCNSCRNCTLCC
jgi:hypothetical protein